MVKVKKRTLASNFPIILLIGGLISIFSSAMLTIEKIALLKNPSATLNCDLNPIVACGPVINTWQASAFGFSNVIIGLVCFSIITVIGVGMLAGAQFKRWFWIGLQLGVTFGIGFILWLQFQSIYRIGTICPFCVVLWVTMIPVFIYTTLYNLREGHIAVKGRLARISTFAQRHHGDILLTWYVVLFLVILQRFWYYWSTLI